MFDYLFDASAETPGRRREQQILDQTMQYYAEHLNPAFLKFKRAVKLDAKGVEWRGHGVYMEDIHGNKFIDCLGGYGVFTLGHCHPHVVKRVTQTMQRIGLYSQELLNPLQAVLAHEISVRAPQGLQYVYYHCGGGESNDAALKLARLATGRKKHVSFTKSFHGKTIGALSATNRPVLKRPFRPLLSGFKMAPYDDIGALPKYITEDVASVLVEVIQGEGGINVPQREFLQAVRRRCTETGALLHVDEVQSGWGRTGQYFCSEHFGLAPDIVTLGKALGGGVFPISALIANPRAFLGMEFTRRHPRMDAAQVAEFVQKAERKDLPGMTFNPWWLTNTFAGSQLGCAAALATIEVYEKEQLLPKCITKGEYLKGQIEALIARYPRVLKEVRGLGMWLGLECRTNALGQQLADELFERDVLVAQTINNPCVLRIQPPLIIEQAQLDEVLSALEGAVKAVALRL